MCYTPQAAAKQCTSSSMPPRDCSQGSFGVWGGNRKLFPDTIHGKVVFTSSFPVSISFLFSLTFCYILVSFILYILVAATPQTAVCSAFLCNVSIFHIIKIIS